MMFGDMAVNYELIGDKEVLAIPFKDGIHSMVIVLPQEGKGWITIHSSAPYLCQVV